MWTMARDPSVDWLPQFLVITGRFQKKKDNTKKEKKEEKKGIGIWRYWRIGLDS